MVVVLAQRFDLLVEESERMNLVSVIKRLFRLSNFLVLTEKFRLSFAIVFSVKVAQPKT
jgi:hypothetical protein